MKKCSKCHINKLDVCFYKSKTTKSGLRSYCKVCVKASNDDWVIKNKDTVNLKHKRWSTNNKDRIAAKSAKRHASKLQRTPNWLTEFDYDYIKNIYLQSSELTRITKVKYEVDHIVPLQGKNVSGLHVPWNLQILTAKKNRSKGNIYV